MNTLHTFGCSFTAFFVEGRKEYKDYMDFRGGTFPKIWSELLSERMGLKLSNNGVGGSSNYDIFQSFCDNLSNIKKDDVVIIGWSFKERFRLVNENLDLFIKVDTGFKVNLPNVSKNTIDEILCNRMNEKWCEEVHSWEKVIKTLSELIGFKLFIWSLDDTFPEHNGLMELFGKMGIETIYEETNGLIYDFHFSEKGHKVQSDYFYDILTNKKQYNIRPKNII
jgi:hypothetical protein